MKPKTFEQKLKRDMYAMGVLFLIFLAVFILTKNGDLTRIPFFFPWIQRRHLVPASSLSAWIHSCVTKKSGHKRKFPGRMNGTFSLKNRHIVPMPSFLSLLCLRLSSSVVLWRHSTQKSLPGVLSGNAVIIVGCLFYYSKKY